LQNVSLVKNLRLELPPQIELLCVATTFTEKGSQSLGLGQDDALSLTLATEEIFANLASQGLNTQWELRRGSHHVELRVSFPRKELDLANLNLVAKVDLADEGDSASLGWLVAARSVDRFQIEHQDRKRTTFVLTKKQYYPEAEPSKTWPTAEHRAEKFREPDEQEVALFCARLVRSLGPSRLLGFLRRPGRLSAMMQAGEVVVRLAFSAQGEPLGGVVLEMRRKKTAVLHGPFLFEQPQETGRRLFHQLLKAVARSTLHGIVAKDTEELYREGELEYLGERSLQLLDGSREVQRMFYRHITEDEGSVVWSPACLQSFLEETFDRLELAREIEAWQPGLGTRPTHSVISTDVQQDQKLVILRPVLDGADIRHNLDAHLEKLTEDGFKNFFFEIDLGESWQMAFAEPLVSCGFQPQLLVPEAARGDVLLFQRALGNEA
jgi:anti-sigma regulatory factor (Ser/Thr protein kinase)